MRKTGLFISICVLLILIWGYTHYNAKNNANSPKNDDSQAVFVLSDNNNVTVSDEPQKPNTSENDKVRVLIYNTHTLEAYKQGEGYTYKEISAWRTDEADKNVSALGAELKNILESEYGIIALHDTKNHESKGISQSYKESLETIEEYKEKFPDIELYIDIHRDYSDSGEGEFVVIDGKECAKISLVVGNGKGATGAGFDDMPDYEHNLLIAQKITEYLNQINPSLAKDVQIKSGRYNQHIKNSILIELGNNANSFEQAKNSIPYIAMAINKILSGNELDN